eukprot:GDKJ01040482.1.p1 GENE.GDKJ01040482.1~~GDKJ01040482.1.p1  ORF type:complete len:443 (-),score=84.86 GDKJ01040482.1:14-1342(-)
MPDFFPWMKPAAPVSCMDLIVRLMIPQGEDNWEKWIKHHVSNEHNLDVSNGPKFSVHQQGIESKTPKIVINRALAEDFSPRETATPFRTDRSGHCTAWSSHSDSPLVRQWMPKLNFTGFWTGLLQSPYKTLINDSIVRCLSTGKIMTGIFTLPHFETDRRHHSRVSATRFLRFGVCRMVPVSESDGALRVVRAIAPFLTETYYRESTGKRFYNETIIDRDKQNEMQLRREEKYMRRRLRRKRRVKAFRLASIERRVSGSSSSLAQRSKASLSMTPPSQSRSTSLNNDFEQITGVMAEAVCSRPLTTEEGLFLTQSSRNDKRGGAALRLTDGQPPLIPNQGLIIDTTSTKSIVSAVAVESTPTTSPVSKLSKLNLLRLSNAFSSGKNGVFNSISSDLKAKKRGTVQRTTMRQSMPQRGGGIPLEVIEEGAEEESEFLKFDRFD